MFKWEGRKVQCTVQLLSSSSSSSSMFNANFFSNWGYYCPINYCHCWAGKVCPMQLTTAVLFDSIFILNWASIKFACSFLGTVLQLSDTHKKTAIKYYYCKLENVERRLLRFALCASCSETFGSAQCRPSTDTWLRFANWPQCAHSEHTQTQPQNTKLE